MMIKPLRVFLLCVLFVGILLFRYFFGPDSFIGAALAYMFFAVLLVPWRNDPWRKYDE